MIDVWELRVCVCVCVCVYTGIYCWQHRDNVSVSIEKGFNSEKALNSDLTSLLFPQNPFYILTLTHHLLSLL